jgi:hypothetical protein
MIHNNNCSGNHCTSDTSEVRVYPLGGGGNLILCHACWAHENRYRFNRGVAHGDKTAFPQLNWGSAEIYRLGD